MSAPGKLEISLALPFSSESSRARPPVVRLKGLTRHSKVSVLKTRIEQDVGILPGSYYLTYLDAAPLDDASLLKDHYIVDGATVNLLLWRIWLDLIKAAYYGHERECLAHLKPSDDSNWDRHCAFNALFTAAHRGHFALVAKLTESVPSVLVNAQGPSGWTALHAAARMNRWKVLCVLVDNGADVRIADKNGRTPFDLARKYKNRQCEKSLNFCQWNLQKHTIVQERKSDYNAREARHNGARQAHQFKDSSLTTWLRGGRGQMYMVQVPNSVSVHDVDTYELAKSRVKASQGVSDGKLAGTSPILPPITSRPPSLPRRLTTGQLPTGQLLYRPQRPQAITTNEEEDEVEEEMGRKLNFDYGWFDPLRAQQLIPATRNVLSYADPSSSLLRPRSLLNPGGYTPASTDASRGAGDGTASRLCDVVERVIKSSKDYRTVTSPSPVV